VANRYLEFEGASAVKVADIERRDGSLPDIFSRCALCDQPAVWLLCLSTDLERYAEHQYQEAHAAALAEELRSQCGSNLEVPVCETHREGSALQ
jgi:hypothetical protein